MRRCFTRRRHAARQDRGLDECHPSAKNDSSAASGDSRLPAIPADAGPLAGRSHRGLHECHPSAKNDSSAASGDSRLPAIPADAGPLAGRSHRYPINGMWKPGASLPSSGQRAVIALPRV